jgi:hypothetical protein
MYIKIFFNEHVLTEPAFYLREKTYFVDMVHHFAALNILLASGVATSHHAITTVIPKMCLSIA